MENLLVPSQSVTEIPCQRALVFAPHPDDEVFGCGGAIMRHIEHGSPVHVIVVSDGVYGVSTEQTAAYISQRQQESIAAAHILGYGTPVFWQYCDRQINYDEKLIQEILTTIRETGADLVYAPSVFEMHPDHRLLAMAVIEAVRRIASGIRIVLYEIGMPLRPNLLLDISNIMPRKISAMECFTSQNTRQRYDLHIASLNRYRTYTLPPEVTAAEAYIQFSAEEIANDPLKLYQSEHSRQRELDLPMTNTDLPLVSVIIRSMDRPTLPEALDSVALQTYPNIEVVIVNAKGAGHREIDLWCGRFPMRMVGGNESLNRSRAANVGLHAAQGKYLIFLDDDDLFYAEHIATLITVLQNHDSARCAYAGIKVEYYHDNRLEVITEFNEPFDQRRLWGRNFIPIHAVLFERSLVTENQCNFDENLEVFEDWDFWIQLTQYCEIAHVDKITAVYRNYGHSDLGFKQDENFLRKSRGKIFKKWKNKLSGEQLDDLIEYREKAIANLRTQSTNNERLIASLRDHAQQDALAATQREQRLNLIVTDLNKTIADRNKTIDDLLHSTSWRITAGLRFLSRLIHGQYFSAWNSLRQRILPYLKRIYWKLPVSWRQRAVETTYRIAGPFFSGLGHYEAWRASKINGIVNLPTDSDGFLAGMVDLTTIPPLSASSAGRIAIHAHMFYADLATEFARFLKNMPYPYDLYVSVPDESAQEICQRIFSSLPQLKQLIIAVAPNRGRDIAPMLCTFGKSLRQYDYIAHIHSKKSLYNNGATDGWREYLLTNLFGSKILIQRIFTLLKGEKKAGLIYPQNFYKLPYAANTWLSNKGLGLLWCNKLGIDKPPSGYFDFPAGSMFWARTDALEPLFNSQIRLEDFPEENGQTDATLAHSIERLLPLVVRRSGYQPIILRDMPSNSWSRWRFEQYLLRNQEDILHVLHDSNVHIIIFDIFDTLLTRPLLHPEKTKNIVAKRIGGEVGKLYLELRATAESNARQKAGRDIGMGAIFTELAMLSGLSSATIQRLRDLEEIIELEMVAPRPEVINLLQIAIRCGKQVVLASDMYLPKSVIEKMLHRNGINEWHEFYLSCETGLRKDTGDFYRKLLSQENISPDAILIIGDNEHSDVQIPSDLGIRKCFHVMRPVELARALPRLGSLIEHTADSDDIDTQLTLGTIVQKNFHPISFPEFNPSDFASPTPRSIGFTIAGPLILSFVQWLIKRAAADEIQRLYFLSREGQIIKNVYDHWTCNMENHVPSEYLVLSRRAVSVATISNLEDIFQIARIQSSPNHLSEFLNERYGLKLSHDDYEQLIKQGLWSRNKLVSIENENIEYLKPVLQALEERILKNTRNECPGLLAYVNSLNLNSHSKSAIVDIGYSATIQGYLNRLIPPPIHGYYMMTTERAQKIALQYDAIVEGYFAHYINPKVKCPSIFANSFLLEKLLSSDDAQIVCYQQVESGEIMPQFRPLDDKEIQAAPTRAEIKRGILDFVDQSITIRDKIIRDFKVPQETAVTLFDEFIKNPSPSEKRILSSLVLDDYYCGRGLVS